MNIKQGDSEHKKVEGVFLKRNAELHRFTNRAGVPYSAIYADGIEYASCERSRESVMINWWNFFMSNLCGLNDDIHIFAENDKEE